MEHHLGKFHRHSSLANGHGRAGVLSLSLKHTHTHTREEGEENTREERTREERDQVTGGSRQAWGP